MKKKFLRYMDGTDEIFSVSVSRGDTMREVVLDTILAYSYKGSKFLAPELLEEVMNGFFWYDVSDKSDEEITDIVTRHDHEYEIVIPEEEWTYLEHIAPEVYRELEKAAA